MTWYVVRRLLWLPALLALVVTVSFVLMRAAPGGPFAAEKKGAPGAQEALEAKWGTDLPAHEYLWRYFKSAAQFDLGPSYKILGRNVNELLAEGIPVSFTLGALALLIAVGVGLTAGAIAGLKHNSTWDHACMSLAMIGVSIPNFLFATLLIGAFVFGLGWFPVGGWGTARQLVLPALAIAAPYAAYIARLSRAGMLDVMTQDFIKTAYAKGLPERAVVLKHALKGAILPVVSFLGPATAGILTGSVVIEHIFQIPGLGKYFVNAALNRDYTVVLGAVLLYSTLIIVLNLVVDVVYAFLDPRVRLR